MLEEKSSKGKPPQGQNKRQNKGKSGVKTKVHEEFHIKGQGHGPLLYERLVRLAGSQNSRVLKKCSAVFLRHKLDFCEYLRSLDMFDSLLFIRFAES